LEQLGIVTVGHLLLHLPLRYEDRTRFTAIGYLQPKTQALVAGRISNARITRARRARCVATVQDETGELQLRFFHLSAAQAHALGQCVGIVCFGLVRHGASGLEMVHPEYRLWEQEPPQPDTQLTPVYPTTRGITQPLLRRLITQALSLLASNPELDNLPATVRERLQLPTLQVALQTLHRPSAETPAANIASVSNPARHRLAFEELLSHHLSLRVQQRQYAQASAPPISVAGTLRERFLQQLPFRLTAAQQRVLGEIRVDLRRPHPMHRLLQGDVGSGKTVVAACAALGVIEAGFQACLMAPTELLAEQHHRSLRSWLEPLGVKTTLLRAGLSKDRRDAALAAIAAQHVPFVVGTHALFQEQVRFARLGLAIIDEQHRFGVHQRLALCEKARAEEHFPHQLVMTATPIPRTLAMTAYANLKTSVIDELPPHRLPVTTIVVPQTRRATILQRITAVCQRGEQVYWVCTLIEDSETLQCQAAVRTAAELRTELPHLNVGLVHGRMTSAEKEHVFAAFRSAELHILVATTVIEVGLDVPNATLLMVENAERLGLAQLHQLRGRIGRGTRRSCCVLMYRGPLSPQGRRRLAALRETQDGFQLAERDLALRGPGELLGTRQSGLRRLRVADVLRDQHLLGPVGQTAEELLDHAPERVAALVRQWVGDDLEYGNV
jgi:ATP-dependent DNA helicase RecG